MTHTLQSIALCKSYKGRAVVKEVSISVEAGQIVGLLGPNGAGKTTCFYMVAGLVPCDAGRVLLGNRDITLAPMHTRARLGIGYLPQEPSVFRRLSVRDNIRAILETRSDLSKTAQAEKLNFLLEEFRIAGIAHLMGISLSGGERRRVEIARALARDPSFILLDEPFAGVDPLSVTDIKREISRLRDCGIGILITDHNVRETLDICAHAYIMNSGSVIAAGPPEEILRNQRVRDVYLGENFQI